MGCLKNKVKSNLFRPAFKKPDKWIVHSNYTLNQKPLSPLPEKKGSSGNRVLLRRKTLKK